MATKYMVETLEVDEPKSPKGRYRTVRLVEVEVVRVIKEWPRCFAGDSQRSAYARAKRDAELVADALNQTSTGRSGTYSIVHRTRGRQVG